MGSSYWFAALLSILQMLRYNIFLDTMVSQSILAQPVTMAICLVDMARHPPVWGLFIPVDRTNSSSQE